MSKPNLFEREGTTQDERTLKARSLGQFQVDERGREELIHFALKYAPLIRYYNEYNVAEGSWEEFSRALAGLNKRYPDLRLNKRHPHFILFYVFCELYQTYAREQLNGLAQRHLDYYYREVLCFEEKPAVPCQVFVLFELANSVETHRLPSQTSLVAGQDEAGVELIYHTDKEIVVNQTRIAQLKSLFVDRDYESRIYAAPVSDSADGLGEPYKEDEDPSWTPFGRTQAIEDERTMVDSKIGFAFASPLLLLSEGKRTVTLYLHYQGTTEVPLQETLREAFIVSFSGPEAWTEPMVIDGKLEQSILTLTVNISETAPPVVRYDAEVLGERFDTKWPVMRVWLNTDLDLYPYPWLEKAMLDKARLEVKVEGMRNLILQNDEGALDPNAPFLPFGGLPTIGSTFYIGCEEAFYKRLDDCRLLVTWDQVPDEDLDAYYAEYGSAGVKATPPKRTNALFQANLSWLVQRHWQGICGPCAETKKSALFLFHPKDARATHTLNIGSCQGRDRILPGDEPLLGYDNETLNGFLKLELIAPQKPFQAFGHKEYPILTAEATNQSTQKGLEQLIGAMQEQVVEQTSYINPLWRKKGEGNILEQDWTFASPMEEDEAVGVSMEPPKEPYTPTIRSLTLNYISHQEMSFRGVRSPSLPEQFFHIGAFGEYLAQPEPRTSQYSLFPSYSQQGYFFLGLSGCKPGQNLNLLFKVLEGSGDPHLDLDKDALKWSYLANDQWRPFPTINLLQDSTRQLQTTGILNITVPKEITDDNWSMPKGLFWLCASLAKDADRTSEMIAVHPQAVTATAIEKYSTNVLPADSITDLLEPQSAIAAVSQPYPSFNGRPKEQSDAFYKRVSERLRHKHRAINLWDFEHLLLEEFSQIYKVKCLNHTNGQFAQMADKRNNAKLSEIPGAVTLVVIPTIRNSGFRDILEPKVGLAELQSMRDYLYSHASPHVEIHVVNPIYEQVQVKASIRLRQGYDSEVYIQQLQEEIRCFLSPWIYKPDKTEEILFGNTVHQSNVLLFIEERPYVDYLYHLSLSHFIPGDDCEGLGRMAIIPSAAQDQLREELNSPFKIVGDIVRSNVNEVEGSSPISILVSAPTHNIEIVQAEDYIPQDFSGTDKELAEIPNQESMAISGKEYEDG